MLLRFSSEAPIGTSGRPPLYFFSFALSANRAAGLLVPQELGKA